jgi:arylsulfatase
MRVRFWVVISAMGCVGSALAATTTAQGARRPNFLLLVADDMGFTDLGSYGGEIATPVLDQLARDGVRFTDFYVSPTCSPTRSMLLSGTDMHAAGLGNMNTMRAPNQLGQPGHEGVLNRQVVTVASLLREGGYHTYMVGKWHRTSNGRGPERPTPKMGAPSRSCPRTSTRRRPTPTR